MRSFCAICGSEYDAALRHMELCLEDDMEPPDTCSDACDREAECRSMEQRMREDVREEQTERECIENGGWTKAKRRKR